MKFFGSIRSELQSYDILMNEKYIKMNKLMGVLDRKRHTKHLKDGQKRLDLEEVSPTEKTDKKEGKKKKKIKKPVSEQKPSDS